LRDGIVAAQESSADASAEAVVDTFLTFFDIFIARMSHGSPLSMSNR